MQIIKSIGKKINDILLFKYADPQVDCIYREDYR